MKQDGFAGDIGDYPLLTREEEADLGSRSLNGDWAAWERLVCCNLRLALHWAKRKARPGVAIDDLMQEAVQGLMKAAHLFDPAKGFRFSTYAKGWVGRYLQMFLCRQDMVRPSRYDAEHGAPRVTIVSLPDGWRDGKRQSSGPGEPAITDQLRQGMEEEETVEQLLAQLPQLERMLVRYHYGIGVPERLDIKHTAALLGINRQRASQLYHKAMAELKAKAAELYYNC